jgi:hypothetical protein
MPAVATLEELERAVRDADASALDLDSEPEALAAARRSLDESGLLLLGEVHGVRENTRLLRALLETLGIGTVGLEWHHELAPLVEGVVEGRPARDHPFLWFGDGRVTAGHFALLRAVRPRLILFDGDWNVGGTWSQRDAAMAERLLAGLPPREPCLVVAGNLHTRTGRIREGVPMGRYLARRRPGVVEVRIVHGGGTYYNMTARTFRPRRGDPHAPARFSARRGHLELALPWATEAVVPQRPFEGGVRIGS